MTVALGSQTSFAVTVKPDQMLSVEPLPLPPGMSLDTATGQVVFVPQLEQAQASAAGEPITMLWTAMDEQGATASSITVIEVTNEPMSGSTRLRGTVLSSETGAPLVGATISIPGTSLSVTTNSGGFFTLTDIPSGALVADIDGASAGGYAFVAEDLGLLLGHELYEGQLNIVERPIYLPQLGAAAGFVDGSAMTSELVELQSPSVPEVTLTFMSDEVMTATGASFTGEMFLPAVTPETTPAALPDTLNPALVMAIQPAGVFFNPPAQITFPNTDNLPVGQEVDIWSVSPETGLFEVAGRGRVDSSGLRIRTIEGGVRAASWHFVPPPFQGPSDEDDENPDGPKDNIQPDGPSGSGGGPDGSAGSGDTGGDSGGGDMCNPAGSGNGGSAGCHTKKSPGDKRTGSWVDIQTGNLFEQHRTAAYVSLGQSRSLRFVYNSRNAYPAPVVNTDIELGGSNIIVPPVVSSRLRVGGVQQVVETFTEGVAGRNRHSAMFDARQVPSGVYPYALRITNHYEASDVGTDSAGRLVVNNQCESPFGAGWTLSGLQRLHVVPNSEDVLLVEGDGGAVAMSPRSASQDGLVADLALILDSSLDTGIGGLHFGWWKTAYADALRDASVIARDSSFAISVIQVGDAGGSSATVEVARTVIDSEQTALDVANAISNIARIGGEADLAAGIELAQQELMLGVEDARQVIYLHTHAEFGRGEPILAADEAQRSGVDELTVFAVDRQEGVTANQPFLERLVRKGRFVRQQVSGSEFPRDVSRELRYTVQGRPLGESSYLRRNADGTITRVMRRGVRCEFTAQGRLEQVVDANGRSTRYFYAGDGLLRRIEDPLGKAFVLSYTDNRLTSVQDPAGRTTRFRHDTLGRLTRITDPDGSTREFEYGGGDAPDPMLMSRNVDKRGFASTYGWSPFGRLESATKADGSTRTFQVTNTVGLRLNPENTSLDEPGAAVDSALVRGSITDGRGYTTEFEFDRFGSPTLIRDAIGRETPVYRRPDGHMRQTDFVDGMRTLGEWNTFGELIWWSIDAQIGPGGLNDQTWLYGYNEQGWLTSYPLPRPLAGRLLFERDASGNVERLQDPQGGDTRYFWRFRVSCGVKPAGRGRARRDGTGSRHGSELGCGTRSLAS
ncbi:MAG: carboxypeptidase-like regulatory domain-containing protein [Planctomycetota bacterium]